MTSHQLGVGGTIHSNVIWAVPLPAALGHRRSGQGYEPRHEGDPNPLSQRLAGATDGNASLHARTNLHTGSQDDPGRSRSIRVGLLINWLSSEGQVWRLEKPFKRISFWNISERRFYRSRRAYPRFGAPPDLPIPEAKVRFGDDEESPIWASERYQTLIRSSYLPLGHFGQVDLISGACRAYT